GGWDEEREAVWVGERGLGDNARPAGVAGHLLPSVTDAVPHVAARRSAAGGENARLAGPRGFHEARLLHEPRRPARRELARFQHHVMRELVRPVRVIQSGSADTGQDVVSLAEHGNMLMGPGDRIEVRLRIMRRKYLPVAAQAFQLLQERSGHALRVRDRAKPARAGEETLRNRRI